MKPFDIKKYKRDNPDKCFKDNEIPAQYIVKKKGRTAYSPALKKRKLNKSNITIMTGVQTGKLIDGKWHVRMGLSWVPFSPFTDDDILNMIKRGLFINPKTDDKDKLDQWAKSIMEACRAEKLKKEEEK